MQSSMSRHSRWPPWVAALIVASGLVGQVSLTAAHQGEAAATPRAHDPLLHVPRARAVRLGRGSWPMYGKDLANSRNGGRGGPSPSAVRRLGGVWSFQSSDGGFTGTPVVAGGKVVVASIRGSVFALDSATGRLRWSRDFNQ